MNTSEYLTAVLEDQKLTDEQLNELIAKRNEVEGVLRNAFSGIDKTIKYGGSRAKHTMIRASYDIDVVCFFDRDENDAGETLEDIFNNVADALGEHYTVESKTSAHRLVEGEDKQYTHIDVVPGRFTDETNTDVFLYQNGSEKNRLKTDTKTHVEHIRDSGLTDTIKLVKLWREYQGLEIFKTFVLELLVIEVLKDHKKKSLEDQLVLFWETLRDEADELHVEDPANPTGNDLSGVMDDCRSQIQIAAKTTLLTIENSGWEAVFGETGQASEQDKISAIGSVSVIRPSGAQPWSL